MATRGRAHVGTPLPTSNKISQPACISQGGTAAAPPELNDRNQEEAANYWASPHHCDYLVTLLEGPEVGDSRVDNLGRWRREGVGQGKRGPWVSMPYLAAVHRLFGPHKAAQPLRNH